MRTSTSFLVEWSAKLYRLLVGLYPKEYRDEYGWLMVQLFRDKAYDAYQSAGGVGVIWHWLVALLDLIVSVVNEHRAKGINVSFALLDKIRSPFMMLGGFLVLLSAYSHLKPGFSWQHNQGLYKIASSLLLPGSILFAIGLFVTVIKLISHFRSTSRSQMILLITAVVFLVLAGIGSLLLLIVALFSQWSQLNDYGWFVLMIMACEVFAALILTATSLFRSGQRWSLLLALHPLWFFVAWMYGVFVEYIQVDTPGPNWAMFVGVVTLGIIWIFAGYKLFGGIKFNTVDRRYLREFNIHF